VSAATDQFDFVIFGAGFAGSIMSMVLRRLGYSVLLLERGKHPRFAIGESSTPFANLLLETIASKYDLPFLKWMSEWGSWQKELPQLAVGLKRGFTFYHHRPGQTLDLSNRRTQLLVGASPNDTVADTHWYRPDFDLFLVNAAKNLGVEYLDNVVISSCEQNEDGWSLILRDYPNRFSARFAIDATGPGSYLATILSIPDAPLPAMPPTHGVYAHFKNVPRLVTKPEPDRPYPPDDAAVHHVFAEGWIWVLRFNNGITSAGAALIQNGIIENAETTWRQLLMRFPTLQAQFEDAQPVTPFFHAHKLSFRRGRAAGKNWALLPSAAGFVDPLLSTGFALTLLGILRLAEDFSSRSGLKKYEKATFTELDAAADLVSALYAKMHSFEEFSLISLLYFAAMSFTETVWRLGKAHHASGFLLAEDRAFTKAREQICQRARSNLPISRGEIARAIEPYDIAGLTDWSRDNFYPINFENLIRARHKLQASVEEIETLFKKLACF
jgi:tetracycline 7-halogenase / FADH2 O2-dependent halogenase